MARKFLYLIVFLVVAILAALVALRQWPGPLARIAFEPTIPFEAQPALANNSYNDPAMWISRPDKGADDPARWLPPGTKAEAYAPAAQKPHVAVFFIHPTSYQSKFHWNAQITDPFARRRSEAYVRSMATPFNAGGNVWAPRYRQATLGAFLSDRPDSKQALALAYGDVLQAFDHFLAGIDPKDPVILVGHSQGAFHLMQLLRDRVAGKPIRQRVVAAYVIGWPVSLEHDLPAMGLPACGSAKETGCVISWQSFAEPADTSLTLEFYARFPGLDGKPRKASPFLCSNPLSADWDGKGPISSANLGTVMLDKDMQPQSIVPGMIPARCADDGILYIGNPPDLGPYVLPGSNYHVYDITMFWANLRKDAARRIGVWQLNSQMHGLQISPPKPLPEP